jgi:peptidoglycan/xylan/chitin deacetylase (PgdA/CDA1 family)
MLISTRMLERHIDWLSKRFTIVSLDELGRYLEGARSFCRPAAAITFDDGYSDVYHHGLPLLKRKGIPGAVFIVTDLVGTGRPQIFDRLYLQLRILRSRGGSLAQVVQDAIRSLGVDSPLPSGEAVPRSARPIGRSLDRSGARARFDVCHSGPHPTLSRRERVVHEEDPFRLMTWLLNALPRETVELIISFLQQRAPLHETAFEELAPLTWDMIETMQRNGIIIGSHTKSHALLTSETLDAAKQQLADSKTTLESRLKQQIRHFAYPDGRFNHDVVEAVRSAGYRFAYSICPQRDATYPLLTVPRKVLWERACINLWGTFSSSIMNCHAHGALDARDRCEHDHSLKESGESNGTIN